MEFENVPIWQKKTEFSGFDSLRFEEYNFMCRNNLKRKREIRVKAEFPLYCKI